MNRREFVASSLAVGATVGLAANAPAAVPPAFKGRFKLKYAPHFGTFEQSAGPDLVDQLMFMHDQGFLALEDNPMPKRPVEEQDRIARAMEKFGMEMGTFVAHGETKRPTFASGDSAAADEVLNDVKAAVEVAKRTHAKWTTIVPGALDPRREIGYQTANAVELLKRCCEVCQPSGLVVLLEATNPWRDGPAPFLSKAAQAYELCKAVNHPCCKVVFDVYHHQVAEGNLIANLEAGWSEVAYVQAGDVPGRREPNTGEINYRGLLKFLHSKGYQGIVGMEHGNSLPGKEGEEAVIKAYMDVDQF